ncbi:cell wall hydrolase [Candidatus Nitrospira salsa]
MPNAIKHLCRFILSLGIVIILVVLLPTGTNNSAAFSPFILVQKKPDLQSVVAQSLLETTAPLTDDRLAALTIYLEARGESFAGKLAVAAVIRNRMHAKYQSDGTVKGTVLKRLQFQPWNHATPEDVRHRISESRMQDSLLAWRMVQDGRKIVQGALLFYNPRLVETPRWATVSHKVASIGGHEFFVPPGRLQV